MYTGLPYKPLHSKAWLERFLKKNFYKASFPWPLRRDLGNTITFNASKLISQCHNISLGISKSNFNSTVGLYEKKNTSTSADYAYICLGD